MRIPHITVIEGEAITSEWLRVTLVVKSAHISSEEETVPGRIAIPWQPLLCGLVSKENQSFPKKAQIILKGHFSLSFKMNTL